MMEKLRRRHFEKFLKFVSMLLVLVVTISSTNLLSGFAETGGVAVGEDLTNYVALKLKDFIHIKDGVSKSLMGNGAVEPITKGDLLGLVYSWSITGDENRKRIKDGSYFDIELPNDTLLSYVNLDREPLMVGPQEYGFTSFLKRQDGKSVLRTTFRFPATIADVTAEDYDIDEDPYSVVDKEGIFKYELEDGEIGFEVQATKSGNGLGTGIINNDGDEITISVTEDEKLKAEEGPNQPTPGDGTSQKEEPGMGHQKSVVKEGKYKGNNTLGYQIAVNRNEHQKIFSKETILNREKVVIEDSLPEGLELDVDSLKIFAPLYKPGLISNGAGGFTTISEPSTHRLQYGPAITFSGNYENLKANGTSYFKVKKIDGGHDYETLRAEVLSSSEPMIGIYEKKTLIINFGNIRSNQRTYEMLYGNVSNLINSYHTAKNLTDEQAAMMKEAYGDSVGGEKKEILSYLIDFDAKIVGERKGEYRNTVFYEDKGEVSEDSKLTSFSKLRTKAKIKRKYKIQKVWSPSIPADVTSVNVFLTRNGVREGNAILLSAPTWNDTTPSLDVFDESNQPINYSAEEEPQPSGYYPTVKKKGSVITVTNTKSKNTPPPSGYSPPVLTIYKVWEEADGRDIDKDSTELPNSITVSLKYYNWDKVKNKIKDGPFIFNDNIVLSKKNDWMWKYKSLSHEYMDGSKMFFVEEKPGRFSGNFKVSYINNYVLNTYTDGFTIKVVNTRTDEADTKPDTATIDIPVKKKWHNELNVEMTDDDLPEDIKNNGIKVRLYKRGQGSLTLLDSPVLTLNAVNGWSGTFSNLPTKEADGIRPIVYEVREESDINGFYKGDVHGDQKAGFTIINRKKPTSDTDPRFIKLKVKKIWKDEGGTPYLPTDDPSTAEDETEIKVQYGFTRKGDGDLIFNQPRYYFDGKWHYDKAPSRMAKDTEASQDKTYNNIQILNAANSAGNGWEYIFKDPDWWLRRYYIGNDQSGGGITDFRHLQYFIREIPKPGFATEVTGDMYQGFTITNTKVGGTSVTVNKVWLNADGTTDSVPPSTITVDLIENVEGREPRVVQTKELTNPWSHTFSNLPTKTKDNKEIRYTVKEKPLLGYFKAGITKNSENNFTITNKKIPVRSIKVSKKWLPDGTLIASDQKITVNLIKKEEGKEAEVLQKVELSSPWTHTFSDLPTKTKENKEISYEITEEELPGFYKPVITDDGAGNVTITNEKIPTTSIGVKKVWNLGKGEVGASDKTITVELIQKVGTKTKVLKEETLSSPWNHTFIDLPTQTSDRKKITYTVREKPLKGYIHPKISKPDSNGIITITNIRPTIDVKVKKKWKLSDGKTDDVNPAITSIKVKLKRKIAMGDFQDYKEVDITKSEDFEYTFDRLPTLTDNGENISYKVEELPVDGYVFPAVIKDKGAGSFVIINVKKPDPPSGGGGTPPGGGGTPLGGGGTPPGGGGTPPGGGGTPPGGGGIPPVGGGTPPGGGETPPGGGGTPPDSSLVPPTPPIVIDPPTIPFGTTPIVPLDSHPLRPDIPPTPPQVPVTTRDEENIEIIEDNTPRGDTDLDIDENGPPRGNKKVLAKTGGKQNFLGLYLGYLSILVLFISIIEVFRKRKRKRDFKK